METATEPLSPKTHKTKVAEGSDASRKLADYLSSQQRRKEEYWMRKYGKALPSPPKGPTGGVWPQSGPKAGALPPLDAGHKARAGRALRQGGVPPMFSAAGPIPSFPAAPLDPDRRHNAATQPYYPAPATLLPALAQPQGSPPASLPPVSPLGPLPSHTSIPSPSSPLPSVSPNPLLLPPLGPQLSSHPHAGLPLPADLPSFPSQVPLGPAWKSSSPLPQLPVSDSSPSHVSAHHANQQANHHHANHQPQQQDSSNSLAGWGPAPPEAAMAGGLKPRPSLSHAPNTAVTSHHMGEGPGVGGGVGPKVVTHHPKGMKDMQLELAVLKTIKAREEVLERLRCAVQKLDTTLGGVAPMALPLGDPLMRLVFRLVGQLRARTLDCVEALGCWHRRTASPTPFMFYGSNYLVGIGHDLVRDLTCPSVAPAWEWVLDVYERLTGTRPPSSDALLLLSGRPTHSEDGPFHPPDAHLWLRLRVAYLGSVWRIRCLGPAAALQTQSLAHRVAQGVIFTLSSAVQRDWYRVGRDIRVGLGGAVPSTWFKGRDPRLDERKFASLWPAASGGWFQRQQGELVVRLSLQWPVPAPPILGAAAEPG